MLRTNAIYKRFTDKYGTVETELDWGAIIECIGALGEVLDYAPKFDTLQELKDYVEGGDIQDYFLEKADAMIEVYSYELREWSVDNYEWIEAAAEVFGNSSDWDQSIMQGQYYMYTQGLNDAAREFAEWLEREYRL